MGNTRFYVVRVQPVRVERVALSSHGKKEGDINITSVIFKHTYRRVQGAQNMPLSSSIP